VRRYGALADEFAIEVAARDLLPVAQVLRDDPQLRFEMLDRFGGRGLSGLWTRRVAHLLRHGQRLQPRRQSRRAAHTGGQQALRGGVQLLSITHNQRLRLRACARRSRTRSWTR